MTPKEYKDKTGWDIASHLIVDDVIMCPHCLKNPACFVEHTPKILAVIDCTICQEESKQKYGGSHLGNYPEFVPERIKEDRKKYFNSIVQPYRDGIPSKEFAEAYPKQAKKYFKGQKPEYVWKTLPGWQHRDKTM